VNEPGFSEHLRLRQDRVIWREVGDEIIGLALESSEYLSPSESATELWRMLAQGTTLQALAGVLEQRWSLTPAQARNDAAAFVDELREQGLLEDRRSD
jgi:hypothetical protein